MAFIISSFTIGNKLLLFIILYWSYASYIVLQYRHNIYIHYGLHAMVTLHTVSFHHLLLHNNSWDRCMYDALLPLQKAGSYGNTGNMPRPIFTWYIFLRITGVTVIRVAYKSLGTSRRNFSTGWRITIEGRFRQSIAFRHHTFRQLILLRIMSEIFNKLRHRQKQSATGACITISGKLLRHL